MVIEQAGSERGHWTGLTPDPDRYLGFVYLVTNQVTGQQYIGKKQYYYKAMIRVAGKKRRRSALKASDWKTYTGSSDTLNKDIASLGIDSFRFTILSQHTGKGDLRYAELMEQVARHALIDDGYYNRQYEAVRYIPKLDPASQYHCLAAYRGHHNL